MVEDEAEEERFLCPRCGSSEVELCFTVWVPANDLEDRTRWRLADDEAPECEADKGWCPDCREVVMLALGNGEGP